MQKTRVLTSPRTTVPSGVRGAAEREDSNVMRMVRRRGRTNRPAQLQHRSSRQIGCRTPSSAMCTSRMLETFAGRSRIGVVERVRASSSRVRLDAGRHGCCLSACATITAHRERDAPGSARTRLRGLAHLPDELGPQLDLLLHSMWPAGRTAPEPPFLPTPWPAR